MRYHFIQDHRTEWPTRLMCQVLEVSTGGFYAWRRRPACARQGRQAALVAEIKAIHHEVKARYGSPRIHAELVARGRPCSVNTVAKLMSREGVAAKTRRKFRCTTDSNHDHPDRRERRGSPVRAGGTQPDLDGRYHLHPDPRGVAVPGGRGGPALAADRRLVDGRAGRQPAGGRCVGDGGGAAPARRGPGGALGSRQPVRQRALPADALAGTGSRAA